MKDIRDRVLELREKLGLSQAAFGEKVSLERSAISLIERKQRNITERSIKDICREFNVNESWLRDGVGSMFEESDGTILKKLKDEYDADELDLQIVSKYLQLKPEKRRIIKEYFLSVASSYLQASPTQVPDEPSAMESQEPTDEEKIAAYRMELAAEKRVQTSEVSPQPGESTGRA